MSIKVAVVGVGNCASSLIQGVAFYRANPGETAGLMHERVGPYVPSDIEFVAAFEVHESKVGQRLADAIFVQPNNAERLFDGPITGAECLVSRGPIIDGISDLYATKIALTSGANVVDVAQVLRDSGAQVVVNYLPVGSEEATRFYAQAAIEAGCGFVNAIPVFLATDPAWEKKFHDAGLPLVGDDIKSQFGATILHRVVMSEIARRGYRPLRTSQLNVGGNMDFLNMLKADRLGSKKKSKGQAVTSMVPGVMEPANVHIGPSDYVQWLGDKKWAYVFVDAVGFAGAKMRLEMKLEVEDSPNSAGVVIDAVRCVKLGMDRGVGGALVVPSAFLMKSPPEQHEDTEASAMMDRFCTDESGARQEA